MRLVVIGSGAAGLSSAYYLSKQGYQVTLVDNVSASLLSPWNIMVRKDISKRMKEAGRLNDDRKLYLYQKHFDWVFEFFQEFGVELRESNIGIVPKGILPGRLVIEKIKQNLNVTISNDTIKRIYYRDNKVVAVEGDYLYKGDAFVFAVGGLGNLYKYSTYNLPPYAFHPALYSMGVSYDFLPFNMFHPFLVVEAGLPRALISGEILTRLEFVDKRGNAFLPGEIAQAIRNNDYHHIFHQMTVEFFKASQKGPIYAKVVRDISDLYENEYGWIIRKLKKMFRIHPAFHYSLGGMATDPYGKTNFENVYAVGEAATGLHGINRIGGTAIAEGIIFGRLLAENVEEQKTTFDVFYIKDLPKVTDEHKNFFWNYLGILKQRKDIPFQDDVGNFAKEIYIQSERYGNIGLNKWR